MTREEIVEVKFAGVMDHDEIENSNFVEVPALDLGVTVHRSEAIVEIKAPCTLLISTSEWTEVYIQKEDKDQTMSTLEPTYTLTKKELESFVWAGWNMSEDGYNSEYYTGSNAELQITVEDTVDSVLIALTEEAK